MGDDVHFVTMSPAHRADGSFGEGTTLADVLEVFGRIERPAVTPVLP